MQRFSLFLTTAIGALALLSVVLLIDDRILDWEEFRALPGENQSFYQFWIQSADRVPGPLAGMWISLRLFGGAIEGLRLPAFLAAFTSLALAAALAPRITREKLAIPLVLFLFGTNAFFIDYARWGIYVYSVGILYSIPMVYLFLRINEGALQRPEKLALALLAFFGIYLDARSGILIMAAGPTAVLVSHFLSASQSRGRLREKTGSLLYCSPFVFSFLLYGRKMIIRVLPWLADSTSTLHNPRSYKPYLYFRYSGVPQNVSGFVEFYGKRTYDLFQAIFRSIGSADAFVTRTLLVFFLIGLGVSVLRSRRSPRRLFLAVYLLIGLALCALLNIAGMYPFGNPRYCLFLMFPVFLLTAWGLIDVLHVLSKAFRGKKEGAFALISLFTSSILLLTSLYLLYNESLVRLRRGTAVRTAIYLMRSDADLVLTARRYECVLRYWAPEQLKKTVTIRPDTLELIEQRLSDADCERITVISRETPIREGDPRVEALLVKWGVKMESCTTFPDRTYNALFHKYNVSVRRFIRRDRLAEEKGITIEPRLVMSTAKITSAGDLELSGWTVSPERIDTVRVLAGDKILGNAEYPTRRPDLAKLYPEFGTDYFGYQFRCRYDPELEGVPITVEAVCGAKPLMRKTRDTLLDERQ